MVLTRKQKSYLKHGSPYSGYAGIHNVGSLDRYVTVFTHPSLPNNIPLDILTVTMKGKHAVPVLKIRRLFELALSNLTTLQVNIYLSTRRSQQLFDGLRFPCLEVFSTSTIDHGVLQHFLHRHEGLQALTIGHCTIEDCPLQKSAPLKKLTNVTGPSACIIGLVCAQTNEISIIGGLPEEHGALFSRLCHIGAIVYSLTCCFFVDDTEALARISDAFPLLTALRLREVTVDGKTGDDTCFKHKAWKHGLQALIYLTCFQLQTTSPLVKQPGSFAAEKKLLETWFGSSRDGLGHIVLWYDCLNTSILSQWSKGRSLGWERQSCEENARGCF